MNLQMEFLDREQGGCLDLCLHSTFCQVLLLRVSHCSQLKIHLYLELAHAYLKAEYWCIAGQPNTLQVCSVLVTI